MFKFKIGDRVLHLSDIQRGTVDIGIVNENLGNFVKVQWKDGSQAFHPTSSLILKHRKQNHPHTTIFK